jgi:hypothetical protein
MAVPKSILFFPGIFNISHFIETGIISFLINYKDMCKNYNIEKRERVRRYSLYCVEHIIIAIREFASFIEPDWEELKKKMVKQFRKADLI